MLLLASPELALANKYVGLLISDQNVGLAALVERLTSSAGFEPRFKY
jgi:hypothetical protein